MVIIEGWFRYHGEFRLARRQRDLNLLFDRNCLSGAFDDPQAEQAAERYQNTRVRIIAHPVPTANLYVSVAPSRIENYCGHDAVLFAMRIEPASRLERDNR